MYIYNPIRLKYICGNKFDNNSIVYLMEDFGENGLYKGIKNNKVCKKIIKHNEIKEVRKYIIKEKMILFGLLKDFEFLNNPDY